MRTSLLILLLCLPLFSAADEQDRAERLIVRLGSTSYERRQAASRELVRLGPAAVPTLLKHRYHRDPETRTRITRVLSQLDMRDPRLRRFL